MKTILIMGAALALAGCKTLENRVSCTVGDGRALYSSMYGPLGLTSKVAEADSAAICKGNK